MCYVLISEDSTDVNKINNKESNLTGVLRRVSGDNTDSSNTNDSVTEMIKDNTADNANENKDTNGRNLTGVDREEEVAIETVEENKKRFSKRDRCKAKIVRRFQYVAGVLSDVMIIHLVNTNGIRNNLIIKREILITHNMLEQSKYTAKGNTCCNQLSAIDMHHQTIEVP